MRRLSTTLLLIFSTAVVAVFSGCNSDSADSSADNDDAGDDDISDDDDDLDDDDDIDDDDDDSEPWDPSGPWDPDLTGHPRLEFGPGDLPDLLARKDTEPYKTLLTRLRSTSNRTPQTPGEDYNAALEYSNANIARAAAFVYLIDGDAAKRDKAVSILLMLSTELEPVNYELIDDDIHIAEAIQGYVFAADYLLDDPGVSEQDREEIRDRLGRLGENCYHLFVELLYPVRQLTMNNHELKLASAMGLLAMLLSDHPQSKAWMNYATTTVDLILTVQTTDGGDDGSDVGFAEGPYYHMYSEVDHLPFWASFDRLVGEERVWHIRACDQLGQNCHWDEYVVQNFADNPRWYELNRWILRIRMPDGSCPALDDSNPTGQFGLLLSGIFDDPTFAWDWFNSPAHPVFTEWCADLAADQYTIYDDSKVIPAEPEFGPSFYLPDTGNAIFRSDWSTDAVYMLFNAENGKIRENGFGHEHPDCLSVILHAHGELLAIDSGYASWELHEAVNKAKNHNLILVDGEGPKGPNLLGMGGDDAFLTGWLDLGDLQYSSGESEYAGASMTRHVVYSGLQHFVVFDRAEKAGNHQYDLLWHMMAGGDTGGIFTSMPGGADAAIGSAKLRLHTIGAAGLSFSTYLDKHGFVWNTLEDHTVLKVSQSGSTVGFATALVPAPSGATLPDIAAVTAPAGSAAAVIQADLLELYAVNPNKASMPLPGTHTGLLDLTWDAEFGLLCATPGSASLRRMLAINAGTVQYGGVNIFSSSTDLTIGVLWGGATIPGHVLYKGTGGRTFDLWVGFAASSVQGEGVESFSNLGGGRVRIQVSEPTAFAVIP